MKTLVRSLPLFLLAAALVGWPSADVLAAKAPTISSVSSKNVLADRVTITWTTNIATDSQVEYGTTTKYGKSSPRDTALVTSHSVTVTGLLANTTYQYRVKSSASPGGSQTVSANSTFTTKPLPPLGYLVQFWDLPNGGRFRDIYRINNRGQVTGPYWDQQGISRAYLYDPQLSPNVALDVESLYPAPDGWQIMTATAISDRGILVGNLQPVDPANPARRGFYVDTAAAQPTVTMLPNWGGWEKTYAYDVNRSDDIFGVYQAADGAFFAFVVNLDDLASPQILPVPIDRNLLSWAGYLNNPVGARPAQLAGYLADSNKTRFRWTVGVGLETLGTSCSVNGLNDAGTICGGSGGYAALLKTTAQPQLLQGAGPNTFGGAVNASGDVLIRGNETSGWLYREDWTAYGKYVDINRLLVFNNQQDETAWFSAGGINWIRMNDRGSANASQISGQWYSPDRSYARGFFLTPIAP